MPSNGHHVRPNGEEETQTLSRLFRDAAALDLAIPTATLPGSLEVTLKIYPNSTRTYWRASKRSWYARMDARNRSFLRLSSILYLRYAKGADQQGSALSQRAQKYVQLGYERLLSYRARTEASPIGAGRTDLALTLCNQISL